MDILTALDLLIKLQAKIREAVAAGHETIDVQDLGDRFAGVNTRIQAAKAEPPDAA